MALRIAVPLGLALMVAGGPARADATPTRTQPEPAVEWHAPPGCPEGDMLDRVAGLVGLPRAGLAAKLLRVRATLEQGTHGGWRVQLAIETSAGSGERGFEAEDCRSMVDGIALVVALAVDPSIATQAAGSSRGGAGGTAHAQAEPGTASPRPRYLLRPQLLAELGVLPEIAPTYGLAAGLAWPLVRVEVDGGLARSQTVTDALGRGGRIRELLSAGARTCVAPWPQGRVEPAGCVGMALAWMRSTGQGIAAPETHDALALALTAGAALGVRLRDWLWLRAELSIGVSVRRPSFEINGTEEIYRVRGLTGRAGGGVELRL